MRDIFSGFVLYLIIYVGYQYWTGDFPVNSEDIPYSIGRVIGEAIRAPYDLVVGFFK